MKNIILAFLILVGSVAAAQIPKPLKHTYVNDFAHVLTAEQIQVLNKQIFLTEKNAGVQLAIVLVDKVPSQYNIKKFSNLIGSNWHVGTNQKGLVYVAAIKQHDQKLAVASNLRDVFDEATSNEILSSLKSDYASTNYYAGLQALVNKIAVKLNVKLVVAQVAKPQIQHIANAKPDSNDTLYLIVGCIAVFGIPALLLIVWLFNRRVNRVSYNNVNPANINQPVYSDNSGLSNPGYSNGYGQGGGSPTRSFATGAIIGGVAGYAARTIQDHMASGNQTQHFSSDNTAVVNPNTDLDSNNNLNNWGNWGANDSSSDSGFDDNTRSSDTGSTGDSSSDNGFDNGSSSANTDFGDNNPPLDSGFDSSSSSGNDSSTSW